MKTLLLLLLSTVAMADNIYTGVAFNELEPNAVVSDGFVVSDCNVWVASSTDIVPVKTTDKSVEYMCARTIKLLDGEKLKSGWRKKTLLGGLSGCSVDDDYNLIYPDVYPSPYDLLNASNWKGYTYYIITNTHDPVTLQLSLKVNAKWQTWVWVERWILIERVEI